MITVRRGAERGQTATAWLDSRHTFSFNRYYDPRYMGFRHLRVINEDWIAPAMGFGTHSHRDMEIITYVVEGALEHRDSLGTSSVIRPQEVQRMSAGTGVSHSEHNASETGPTHLLQIWIEPERPGGAPGYEQRLFSAAEREGRLRLVASGDGRENSVTVQQDVALYDALLSSGESLTHRLAEGRHAWVQVVKGALELNGIALGEGDGAAVSEERTLELRAAEAAAFVLFDLA